MVTILIPMSVIQAQNLKIMQDGVVIPKVDRNIVFQPEEAQMVYDTVTNSVWYFDNSMWIEIGGDNLGNHIATETLEMANELIKSLGTPVDDTDAATKLYVDQHEDADSDPTNELQTITASVEGDTMYMSNGSWLIVPGLSDANYIKDFEGNVYTSVDVGDQTWLKEHLKSTKYNDGTPIENITDQIEWGTTNNPALCWYDNDSIAYHANDGVFYNYFVVADTNALNICPVGWHVPSKSEIETLATTLGGVSVAGGKLKESGFTNWSSPNTGATNSSNMTLLGTGNRNSSGSFINEGSLTAIWSSSNALPHPLEVWNASVWYTNATLAVNSQPKRLGLSVRCIKD